MCLESWGQNQSKYSQHADGANKSPGHDVPERGRGLVFSNDQHFPVAILHILAKKSCQRAAYVVPTANTRGLINLSSRPHESKIVLIILVTHQFFVKKTDPVEDTLPPAAVDYSVHETFIRGLVRTSSADRPGTVEDCANRLFHQRVGPSLHRSADI